MITRRSAIVRGAALVGAAGLIGPPVARAQPHRDAALLRGAVRLEQLAGAAYAEAASSPDLPADVVTLAATLGAHEADHADVLAAQLEAFGVGRPAAPDGLEAVEALARELGAPPVAPALRSGGAFLAWAQAAELRQIAVYVDGAGRALEQGLTQTLGSILAAEGQHLAAVRHLLGRDPVRRAFEPGG